MVILCVVCLSVGSILVLCCHHVDSMGERSMDSTLERGGRKVMEVKYNCIFCKFIKYMNKYMYIYIYLFIYRERERERER